MVNSASNEILIDPLLLCEHLIVHRGRSEILHGLDFTLAPGSITGLIGPSGCGKTTLMRSIVGVQHITSGELTVLGLPAGHRELRQRIAYTSQGLSIYRDLSVRDNVAHFARLLNLGNETVTEAIHAVELDDYAHRRVETLSGGQASRVSLACALVGKPELLVLDEPTVGLDPLTRTRLWDYFRQLADQGATLLISSHVMDEARRCDNVLFMREGHFLASGPIVDLQERTHTTTPEDAFLAIIADGLPSRLESQPPHSTGSLIKTEIPRNEATYSEQTEPPSSQSTSATSLDSATDDVPRATGLRLPAWLTTVGRITAQLKSDRRTVALILIVPAVLLTLLYYVFSDIPVPPGGVGPFQQSGPTMLAVLPMLMMFLVTSIVMLRERTTGTLEKIMTTPLKRWNLIASYAGVFGGLSLIQSSLLAWLILGPMGVEIAAPVGYLLGLSALDGLFGVALGLWASAFARTEFQAVQFMPIFITPQLFLCGLFVARDRMPKVLETISDCLPMTWAVKVVEEIRTTSEPDDAWRWFVLLAIAIIVLLVSAATTIQRKTR